MKMVKIEVVSKPKSFDAVKFSEAEWKVAKAAGSIDVPAGTALENLRNSRGMYRIVPDQKAVEIILKGLSPVDEMDGPALFAEMASHGKPPRKNMPRSKAREFVASLRAEAAEMIVDD